MSLLNTRTSLDTGDSDDACCGAMANACCINSKEDIVSTPGGTPVGNPLSLVMEEVQGYDVDFDPPLENKYECPICLMALREAVQTPCGHRFCKACIMKSLSDAGHKCPVDNEILLETQLFPDNFAKREILSLTVKCPSDGCTAKMELRHLEHHKMKCEFATVDCRQCQKPFQKFNLDAHMKMDCPRRQVSCTNCAQQVPYEDMMQHDQNCPLAYVTCEYCQENLIRDQLHNHCAMDCEMAPITCTYSQFGCTAKMQRNELALHLQEFTQAHMQMMAHTVFNISSSLTPTSPLSNLSFTNLGAFQPGPPSVLPVHSSLLSHQHDCSQETQHLRETIDQLEGRLVRQDHQIRELIAKMETQTNYVTELKQTIRSLEDKMVEVEAQHCNGIFVWKIGNFSTHLKNQEEDRPVVIHSQGFYTGKPGYKLCLRLHLQLPSAQRCSNYISLFVHTMQGEYDSLLPWPFQGTIRLSVLDQSEGSVRQDQEEVMETKPDLLAFQKPTSFRNPKGFGYVTFMHIQALKQRQFLKNDTLLVRCSVITHTEANSLRREGFNPRSSDGTL
ncbi:TNF receptor-associated factor 6 [Pelobates fuscus]|uniref:TNF receptor-associated factor 6 n=1 Tax=Pelobates fuscus TaxID=191477 RepID=UPI002FE4D907